MTVLQKAGASIDLDRHRLRRFMDEAVAAGQAVVIDEPVDLADVASHLEGNEKAVLFAAWGRRAQSLPATSWVRASALLSL